MKRRDTEWDNRFDVDEEIKRNGTKIRKKYDTDDEDFINEAWESTKLEQKPKKLHQAKKEEIKPTYSDLPLTTFDEQDTSSNPYPEEPKPLTGNLSTKVHFTEVRDGIKVHEYTLQDEAGGYTNLITTGSSVLSTFKEWNKPDNGDEELYSIPKLRRAQKNAKKDFGGGGSKFDSSVPILRDTLATYLNVFSFSPHNVTEEMPYMTMNDRQVALREAQDGTAKKEFYQFVPSIVFQEIETWLFRGAVTYSPFEKSKDEDVVDFSRFVFDPSRPDFSHIDHEGLRRALHSVYWGEEEGRHEVTGLEISEKYAIGRDAGTALHAYLEYRLTDPVKNTPAKAREEFPCREEHDYMLAEHFINNQDTSDGVYEALEMRVSSFRHKICGSIDLLKRLPDGRFRVEDFKRTPAFNKEWWFKKKDKDGIRRPVLGAIALSSETIKYAIQMAVYRKLLILNGTPEKPIVVDKKARLIVLHPTLRYPVTIELDLDEKMMEDKNGYFCGIGVARFGEKARRLSPIELVELLFEFYESELRHIFFGDERRL